MRVSIIGTGYVGLVSGACLADVGHEVVCVDVDASKVAAINSGKPPFHELGLPELLTKTAGKSLHASTDLADAVARTDLTMLAVGTPAAEGRIDLQYVERAAAQVGAALRQKSSRHTVIVKSTVIPGTTDGVVRSALEQASGRRAGEDFGLGMNPEFLTEGRAVDDFRNPDRLVLGGVDGRTHQTLQELYRSFDSRVPRVLTNNRTAEMIKYASNSLLAASISFANEIARLCTAVGDVDALEVMRGVHHSVYLTTVLGEQRVKASLASFLEAGCGFGGSCLPKDVTALVAQGKQLGVEMPLLRSVLEINRGQPDELLRIVAKHYPSLAGVKVAVLGLAFKPDTDDVRESPAFPILRRLRAAGASVSVFDPVARPMGHDALEGVQVADSLEAAVATADVVILVTRWQQFQPLGALLKRLGRAPLVVDGRRTLNPADFARYEGIGRNFREAS